MQGFEEQLGKDNIKTLDCKMNLAVLLRNMREQDEAKALFMVVVAGYEKALGGQNVKTVAAKKQLESLCAAELKQQSCCCCFR